MSTSREEHPSLAKIDLALSQLGYVLTNEFGRLRYYMIPQSNVSLFLEFDDRMTYQDLDYLLEENGINVDAFHAMLEAL